MKPNRPSLFLYFTVCILIVFFKIIEDETVVVYLKSILAPIMFIFYLITNNYKISWTKALVFLFCFIGDLFFFIRLLDTDIGGLLCFLVVYSLLLKLSFDDFMKLNFNKKDSIPLLVLLFFIIIICTSVLSLKFEKIEPYFYLYIIYGILISILSFVSISNYIKKGNYTFFSLVMMCVCFIISDVFFIIHNYYLNLNAISFLNLFSILFVYFFMTTYFIESDKYNRSIKQ